MRNFCIIFFHFFHLISCAYYFLFEFCLEKIELFEVQNFKSRNSCMKIRDEFSCNFITKFHGNLERKLPLKFQYYTPRPAFLCNAPKVSKSLCNPIFCNPFNVTPGVITFWVSPLSINKI